MTSGQVIAAELRLGIVSGEIESHIQLSENQVAQQFNVSRSPVRDAFKLLPNRSTDSIRTYGRSGTSFW